jgi:hypothetical protein
MMDWMAAFAAKLWRRGSSVLVYGLTCGEWICDAYGVKRNRLIG